MIERAFADAPRPDTFIMTGHCPDCAEQERRFRRVTRGTLSSRDIIEDWSPIGVMTESALKYWLPDMARVSANELNSYFFLPSFVLAISEGTEEVPLDSFDQKQLSALEAYLRSMKDVIESREEGYAIAADDFALAAVAVGARRTS